MIAAADFVTTGGMDIANWHLAEYLARTQPVELVSHRVDPQLAGKPNIHTTLVPRPFGMNMLGEPLMRRTARRRAKLAQAAGIRVVANGGNCPVSDLNWAHYVHSAFTPVTAGSPIRRIKTKMYHRYCVRTERQAFASARFVICNSKLTAGHVRATGVPDHRIRVVYYGSDPNRLRPIRPDDRKAARTMLGWGDEPVAVFVGALGDRRKGFDVLYAAWRTLCRNCGWDVRLAVIGRGAELDAWKRRAADDGLASRVEFLGFRSDVPQVLAGCDVMVHPARYEAYGLGVHEAVARGLPAIVSARAGVSERLADALHDLLLDNPEDEDMLADTLKRWRQSLEHWREAAAPVGQRLREHTWDDMTRQIESVAN